MCWRKIWSNSYQSYASVKAKQFQWKFLHNVPFTEHKLNLMGVSNGLCNICKKERETLIHLFWDCPKTKQIWKNIDELFEKITKDLNLKIEKLSFLNIAFGYRDTQADVINTILFETKWQIWKYRNDCKFSSKLPNQPLVWQKIAFNNTKEQLSFQNIKYKDISLLQSIFKYL